MSLCAIWGAPQSGKTTLSVNLAYAVSRGDKSACLISPAAYGELASLLGIKISETQCLTAALQGSSGIRHTVCKVDELFYVLAAAASADAFENDYTAGQAKALLALCRETFDVVIVDCPSESTNLLAAWALNKADSVALCSGGRNSCVMWYAANRKAVRAVEHKSLRVSSELTSDYDYDAMYQLLECTPDIRIPYVREAPLLQNECAYLYELSGKRGWAYARAVNKLYEVIAQ